MTAKGEHDVDKHGKNSPPSPEGKIAEEAPKPKKTLKQKLKKLFIKLAVVIVIFLIIYFLYKYRSRSSSQDGNDEGLDEAHTIINTPIAYDDGLGVFGQFVNYSENVFRHWISGK